MWPSIDGRSLRIDPSTTVSRLYVEPEDSFMELLLFHLYVGGVSVIRLRWITLLRTSLNLLSYLSNPSFLFLAYSLSTNRSRNYCMTYNTC